MKEYTTEDVRNIALIGHGSSGKTMLAEAMLFASKAIKRLGSVEDGTTVTDFDEEEVRRNISLSLGMAPVEWKKIKLNLLDTPGDTDFAGEVRSALRVADLALSVVDAASGVEVGTELTWGYADDEGVPRAVVVNKMDRENASFENTLASLNEVFDVQFLPLMLPIGSQDDFAGVINLLEQKAYMGSEGEPADIPDDLADQVESMYTEIVEASVEADEELMMKYFEDEPLTPEEIYNGLRAVIAEGNWVPVLVTAGGEVTGVRSLMDVLIDIAPSPAGQMFEAEDQDGELVTLPISDNSSKALLVFKTTADPYVGKLTYFRVYGGMVSSAETVYNVRADEDERLGQIFSMQGNEQLSVETLHAGDIGAVAKMAEALTGDTLTDEENPIVMEGPTFPEPLYSVSINPVSKADTAKMGSTLTRLCEEDPTLHWHQDPITNETILSGMGDTHVGTAVRRMQSRFNVNVEQKTPKVPYRETVTAVGASEYRHKKQSGGAGQFAEVHMRLEPRPRDEGFEYEWEVFGGRISTSFRPSIEKGIKQVLGQGAMAGYPIVDVLAAVYDGKEHPVDSKDIAFQIAGREAFKEAFLRAKPVLLEPIYEYVVTVPNEFAGAVMSDLNTRRGRVQGMAQEGTKAIITAEAPLAEMQRYATNLRAITQARGLFSLKFVRYDVVPSYLAEEIVQKARAEED